LSELSEDRQNPEENQKLPLWRLIAGILVLVAMVVILLSLAPVYFEDYQLRQYVRSLVRDPNTTPDETLRSAVLARSRQLDLPVESGDVGISHPDGKLQIQLKYAVQIDFPLYQVELHFHPGATGR
jgi:hypothetical protein